MGGFESKIESSRLTPQEAVCGGRPQHILVALEVGCGITAMPVEQAGDARQRQRDRNQLIGAGLKAQTTRASAAIVPGSGNK
jgi:hypothetical protein